MSETDILFNKLPDDLSIITKVWGPPTWFFLHSMTLAYFKKYDPNIKWHVDLKKSMKNLLYSLVDVLPCPICGESYSQYIKRPDMKIEDHLDSRKDLFTFMYKIHNLVNKKLGKPECQIPTLKEAIEYYSKYISSYCSATTDEEKNLKKQKGCKDEDFHQYKCIVDVIDLEKKQDTTSPSPVQEIENFANVDSNNLFLILFIVFLIITIILLFILFTCFWKNKKVSKP